MRKIRWAVSKPAGEFFAAEWVEVDDEVYEHCAEVWKRVKAAVAGPARTALVNELRTMLDFAVEFPGGQFVEVGKASYVPPYIERSRQREDAPPGKPASVPYNEFPEGY